MFSGNIYYRGDKEAAEDVLHEATQLANLADAKKSSLGVPNFREQVTLSSGATLDIVLNEHMSFITIVGEGEEEVEPVPPIEEEPSEPRLALFRVQPKDGYPQAIIVEDSSTASGLRMIDDQTIEGENAYSQIAGDSDELLTFRTYNDPVDRDSSIGGAYESRDLYTGVYVGGYLLVDAPTVIGAATVGGVYCFVVYEERDHSANRVIKFYYHPLVYIDYDKPVTGTPIIDWADCALAATTIVPPVEHTTICTFSGDGATAYIAALSHDVFDQTEYDISLEYSTTTKILSVAVATNTYNSGATRVHTYSASNVPAGTTVRYDIDAGHPSGDGDNYYVYTGTAVESDYYAEHQVATSEHADTPTRYAGAVDSAGLRLEAVVVDAGSDSYDYGTTNYKQIEPSHTGIITYGPGLTGTCTDASWGTLAGYWGALPGMGAITYTTHPDGVYSYVSAIWPSFGGNIHQESTGRIKYVTSWETVQTYTEWGHEFECQGGYPNFTGASPRGGGPNHPGCGGTGRCDILTDWDDDLPLPARTPSFGDGTRYVESETTVPLGLSIRDSVAFYQRSEIARTTIGYSGGDTIVSGVNTSEYLLISTEAGAADVPGLVAYHDNADTTSATVPEIDDLFFNTYTTGTYFIPATSIPTLGLNYIALDLCTHQRGYAMYSTNDWAVRSKLASFNSSTACTTVLSVYDINNNVFIDVLEMYNDFLAEYKYDIAPHNLTALPISINVGDTAKNDTYCLYYGVLDRIPNNPA